MDSRLPATKSEVEEYWQHTETKRTRPKLVRRTSSMLDFMRYNMSLAVEVPATAQRDEDSENWKIRGSSDDITIQLSPDKAKSVPLERSSVSLSAPDKTLLLLRSRIRHESEPLPSDQRGLSSLGPSPFRRTMDSSGDQTDGLFSRPFVLRYEPVKSHWFFCRKENNKDVWVPFTLYDSKRLEEGFQQYRKGDLDHEIISTQGNRYDVSLKERKLHAVYWDEEAYLVRRGTWFWKAVGEVWVPYEEVIADKLEGEYKLICRTGQWQKRIDLPGGETIILHSDATMIHYDSTKSWSDVAETLYKNQKIVKRGWEGLWLPDEGEWEPVDHLVFVSHGIGSYCDLKWRTLNQCVDAYRLMTRNIAKEHFNFSGKKGKSFRVEFIPINWHGILHSDNAELENRIKRITLPSIPIVRYFANDYVLDILFYSSPLYCKVIADHVGDDMNRLYRTFMERNAGYKGGVSIIGHSLGSIVLFDMLSHQPERKDQLIKKDNPMESNFSTVSTQLAVDDSLYSDPAMRNGPLERHESTLSVQFTAPAFSGAGYPSIRYPVLQFRPACFFAIGSPIGMFLAVRGVSQIGEDYSLPTCSRFLNIFHPNDPVAYRIEPLIIPEACKVPPSVIDHHKGRKRMHLEVQKNFATVASSLKSNLLDPMKLISNLATTASNFVSRKRGEALNKDQPGVNVTSQSEERIPKPNVNLGPAAPTPSGSAIGDEIPKIRYFGQLNGGRRIDYVLQETPLESLNQYLFALNSHAVYWDSEDTLLCMLRQIIEIEKDNISVSAEASEEEEHQYI